MQALRWGLAVVAVGWMSLARAADDEAPKPSKEEQQLIDLTNQARAKEKLPPLKVNAVLMKAAQGHSANMAKQQKMAHELDGKKVGMRLDDVKYDWKLCGENVGLMEGGVELNALFGKWMKSKSHRENILDGTFEEIGLVIVRHPTKKEWYVTQVFGTLDKN